MNKNLKVWSLAALACLSLAATTTSCSDDNSEPATDNRKWSTDGGLKAADNLLFDGNQIGNGDNQFVFKGKQTLKKGTYILKGWVYIADGSELTIEPGTIIKGDKQTMASLIVERGGKLIAQGTKNEPIVFTSEEAKGQRRPGDWGGIIMCGKAKTNAGEQAIEGGPRTKHGGNDDADNSGVLSYVRVEFAGYPFETNQEINGVTLGSVGTGTKIDHVQVSYSNDDSFEWFGGKVNAKYLVAYEGWDDDFDTDNGYSGNVQYALSIRDPKLADTSNSNGFESDNDASGSTATPTTNATFSNVTFVGPKASALDFENTTDYINGGGLNPGNGSALGRFQASMHIRRGSHLQCINSISYGWPVGIIIDGEKGNTRTDAGDTKDGDVFTGAYNAKNNKLVFKNIWMAGMTANGADANSAFKDSLVTKYGKPNTFDDTKTSFSSNFFAQQPGCQFFKDIASWGLQAPMGIVGLTVPLFPQAGSPLLTAGSTDGFSAFDKVNYIGAFNGTDNWLEGWTNFDPQNTDY